MSSPLRYGSMEEKKRILIADDSTVVTAVLVTALEKEGYVVEAAPDGQAAYRLGKEGNFDLAVLDQLMPGMLGLEIIQKWHEEGTEMPVMMLSAVKDDSTAIQSIELGATDFIRKPFRIPELVARIKQRLAN